MVRKGMSKHRKKLFVIVCVSLLFAGVILFLQGMFLFRVNPKFVLAETMMRLSEDTQYAAGFSESAFREIRVGDSVASVQKRLGRPLKSVKVAPYSVWLYAPKKHPQFADSGRYPDMRYSYTAVRFDKNGHFEKAFGQLNRTKTAGLVSVQVTASLGNGQNTLRLTDAQIQKLKQEKVTQAEFRKRLGGPSQKYTSDVVEWLEYSRSPGSNNYRIRKIGINGNGKVSKIRSELYWD